MISLFWFIGDKADFKTSRSGRIGASDVPAIFQNPEHPTESLAGFGQTALTVYQQKTGEVERESAGLPAEIGHHDENKTLELMIRPILGYETALRFRILKERYEADSELAAIEKKPIPSARNYQLKDCPFLHSTEYYDDKIVVHPDCLYIGNKSLNKKERFIKIAGIRIDLSKPFLIEAKSAKKFAARRPEGSFSKGYDFNLTGWQGIPLKHHLQTQFQGMIFQVDTVILALLHDTSDFNIWKTGPDKKVRGSIADRVGYLAKCIETGTVPKKLAMNADDVKIMIPNVEHDYITLSGEKLGFAEEIARKWREAIDQEKKWKAIKTECQDAAAVVNGDFEEVRGPNGALFKWEFRKGSEGFKKKDPKDKLSAVAQMKRDDQKEYRRLVDKGWIYTGKPSRHMANKWKGDE